MTDALLQHAIKCMAEQSRRDQAKRRAADQARPHGEQGVHLDFYSRREANRPYEDARWAVWLVSWDSGRQRWMRRRRLTGPREYMSALTATGEIAGRRGLLRVS